MKEVYERVEICEICGQNFKVTSKHSHPKRCPECAAAITGRRAAEVIVMKKKRSKVSNLDVLARQARRYGLSYGQYVGMKRAGYRIRPIKKKVAIDYREEEWIAGLYAIVERGRKRKLSESRKGGEMTH